MAVATPRKTAAERREAILQEALVEFADKGLAGASTDAIARRAGISQPYLFRLFGTKKELFVATVERCLRETLEMFHEAAAGLSGEDALKAIGEAYMRSITEDPVKLRGQMQSYAACQDDDVCAVVRKGYGELVEFVERVSGVAPQRIVRFFGKGMLLNVIASMHLLTADEPWARRLLAACQESEA
jgi:AcrR family transcriptional regulator